MFINHQNYNCEITLNNGETYRVYANWLHNENLDYWEGWDCSVGVSRILVSKDGSVYDGECRNSYLGNLNTEWNLKESNTCTKPRCNGCTDDLMSKKHKK